MTNKLVLNEIPVQTQKALALVDDVLQFSREDRNPIQALDLLAKLQQIKQLSGIMMSKTLWSLYHDWHLYDMDTELSFFEVIVDHVNLNKVTIERRIRIWEMLENHVPDYVRDEFLSKPIRELTPIANMVHQKYDLDDDDWKDLSLSSGLPDVAEIVRDIKQKPPRSNTIIVFIDDEGNLFAKKNGEKVFIGFIDQNLKRDSFAYSAIQRIISSSNIIQLGVI